MKNPEIKGLLKLLQIQEKAAIEIRTGGEQVPPLKKCGEFRKAIRVGNFIDK